MSKTKESRLEKLQDLEPSVDEFRTSVIDGLSGPQKTLPCKFLYDERGSQIFDDICDLPEYYPTRTERLILERHARDIAALAGPRTRLIEFGSGAGTKIRLLLRALDKPAAYLPVEISRDFVLDPQSGFGRRIVLDLAPTDLASFNAKSGLPESARPAAPAAEIAAVPVSPPAERLERRRVVVIDAGHGGVDPSTDEATLYHAARMTLFPLGLVFQARTPFRIGGDDTHQPHRFV